MQNKAKKIKEKIVRTFVDELRQSTFYQVEIKSTLTKCLERLEGRKIEQVLCYGLGTFRNGVDIASRYQLALLLLLYEYLSDQNKFMSPVIEVYDPSFDELDQDTLLSFTNPKFKLISENEYCARELISSNTNGCVLIYMPHLDKYLYNNLLGANWSPEHLKRLVILGNSFHEMIDSEILSKRNSELYYMNQLVGNFKKSDSKSSSGRMKSRSSNKSSIELKQVECQIPEALVELLIDDSSFEHSDIFNSLSFHLISAAWIKNNSTKIQKLLNWTCVTSCPVDDGEEWISHGK